MQDRRLLRIILTGPVSQGEMIDGQLREQMFWTGGCAGICGGER